MSNGIATTHKTSGFLSFRNPACAITHSLTPGAPLGQCPHPWGESGEMEDLSVNKKLVLCLFHYKTKINQ